jgi:predicted ATPase
MLCLFNRALKELSTTTHCSMGRMSPVQIEALAAHILNIPTLPTELANLLVSRSQGNPLFLHELVKVMKEQGVLWVDEKTQTCETRVQVAWVDKAVAVACFGCQAKLPSKERNRCKACGYVFCGICTPKQCFK